MSWLAIGLTLRSLSLKWQDLRRSTLWRNLIPCSSEWLREIFLEEPLPPKASESMKVIPPDFREGCIAPRHRVGFSAIVIFRHIDGDRDCPISPHNPAGAELYVFAAPGIGALIDCYEHFPKIAGDEYSDKIMIFDYSDKIGWHAVSPAPVDSPT
jgi:hypothetical protein